MKTGGFPCRSGGCDVVFTVREQNSMSALNAASAQRTEHELAAHAYKHRRLDEITKTVWSPSFKKKPPEAK